MNLHRILQLKVIPPQSLICVSLKRKTVRSSLPPALVSIFFISCRMRKIFCFPEQLKVLSRTVLEIGFNSLRVHLFNRSRLFFLKLRNHLGKLVVIPNYIVFSNIISGYKFSRNSQLPPPTPVNGLPKG